MPSTSSALDCSRVAVLELLADAEDELNQAAQWCEDARSGLGLEFLGEVLHTQAQLALYPESGATWTLSGLPSGVRRRALRRFPYLLINVTEPRLVVVAVAHTRRQPGYWAARLQAI